MQYATSHLPAVKLSVCIATLNRAAFIGTTLDSILAQLTDDCEVVVLDGASTDDTERVMSEYQARFARLRYIRQVTNNGFDQDYDRVVELARGKYCWLMTDDDLFKPGAVAAVLAALDRSPSLVVVTTEIRDLSLSRVLQHRWPDFASDRVYGPSEMDRLFVEVGGALYCNAFIVDREMWLARERQRYYGSLHIYMGVIFQQPLPADTVVIAEPLISHRLGNAHTFSAVFDEVVWVKWPTVVESLALSKSAKSKVYSAQPWSTRGRC